MKICKFALNPLQMCSVTSDIIDVKFLHGSERKFEASEKRKIEDSDSFIREKCVCAFCETFGI